VGGPAAAAEEAMLTTTDTMHAITTEDHLPLLDIAASPRIDWAPAIARADRFSGARAFADGRE